MAYGLQYTSGRGNTFILDDVYPMVVLADEHVIIQDGPTSGPPYVVNWKKSYPHLKGRDLNYILDLDLISLFSFRFDVDVEYKWVPSSGEFQVNFVFKQNPGLFFPYTYLHYTLISKE